MKNNPVATVKVSRGGLVENIHQVDIVVSDAEGGIVEAWGDVDRPVFPRSSIKALQALPLVESGAADKYGFGSQHLALACSSHHAEFFHVASVRQMFKKAGISEQCLECGPQMPRDSSERKKIQEGEEELSSIHNGCSGKHAGFLAFAEHAGLDKSSYTKITSQVQKEIANVLQEVVATPHTEKNHGIDGCAIPTYQIPLSKLALAYAKFGVGEADGRLRSSAMIKLRDACCKHPEMVAGTLGACTRIMQAMDKRVFVKYGAEGVYTAALPELGFGIALKVRDGNAKAAETTIASLATRLLELDQREHEGLTPIRESVLKNWSGTITGKMWIDL
ncbi:MAG: asparaginase [Pseudomonadota bacterium]